MLPAFHLNPELPFLEKTLRSDAQGRPDFFLGHRRLSIIDLAPTASQPMTNENKRVWVIFNGEIYNYQELRAELVQRGHQFQTDHSDTEVLVHGYEEWGVALLDKLRGMFAFAILDLEARKVLLARDPFGEKPLYIVPVEGGFAFASELKALLAGQFADRAISPQALADFLRFGYVPAPKVIYRGVTKLQAAEFAIVDLAQPTTLNRARYWNLKYEPRPVANSEAWYEEFQHELTEAVRLRMLSDVPLGAFLSGGLDSTTVVSHMAKANQSAPRTFNIGFTEAAFDESRFAAQAADFYGARHSSRKITPDDLLACIPELTAIFDEPFADASALPTLAVAKMAREQVTVCLSGDGGDELLAGYTRYATNNALSRWFDHAPGKALGLLLRPLVNHWPERVRGGGLVTLLRSDARARYEPTIGDDWLRRHSNLAEVPEQYDFGGIWDKNTPTLIDRMCKADIDLYIPEDLMVKVDRTAMATSLEVRAPFLDRRLFEMVARSPLELRFGHKGGKIPFQRALSSELGTDFVERPKQGFGVPLGSWFRRQLKQEIHDIIAAPDAFVTGLFAPGTVMQLLKDHVEGSRDQSHRLWRLLTLELWHRHYRGGL